MNTQEIRDAAFVDELEKIADGEYQKVKGGKAAYLRGKLVTEALQDPEYLGESQQATRSGALKGLGIGTGAGGAAAAALLGLSALKGSGLRSGLKSALSGSDKVKSVINAIKNTKLQNPSRMLPTALATGFGGALVGTALGADVAAHKHDKKYLGSKGIKQTFWGNLKATPEAKKRYGV